MNENNILVTGTPRSGTTLTCHLLNKIPDTLALHEPMRPRSLAELASPVDQCDAVARFFAEQRRLVLTEGRAISKNLDGQVPDNPVGTDRTPAGLRRSLVSKGYIAVDKSLSPDFALIIKHNSSFTALLDVLVESFPVFAVVRNPLATLGSWSSVSFKVQNGHAKAGEQLSPALKRTLGAIADPLDRQIALLDWFYAQFLRLLPRERIIRYEEIISSGGKRLNVIRSGAASLDEPLVERTLGEFYDPQHLLRMGERLLESEGAYWGWYSRESVVDLLDGLRSRIDGLVGP